MVSDPTSFHVYSAISRWFRAALLLYLRGTLLRFRSTEFTDEEIAAAFKFLDLDHNLHIGAAEIRHILICMGELITDEEVTTLQIQYY